MDKVGEGLYRRAVQWQAGSATPLEVGADLVAFLASTESDGIPAADRGRLGPVAQLEQREKIAASDVYTLRRIVPEDRGWETP